MKFSIGDKVNGAVSGDEYVIKGVDEGERRLWVQRVDNGSYLTFGYSQVKPKPTFFEIGKIYRDSRNGATFHCKDVGMGWSGDLVAWGVVTANDESAHVLKYPGSFGYWEEV